MCQYANVVELSVHFGSEIRGTSRVWYDPGQCVKAVDRTQSVVSKSKIASRRMDVIEVRQYCLGIGVGFVRFAEIYEAELASGAETAREPKKRTY
jgi:hypothetical protein